VAARVIAVSRSAGHTFSKPNADEIALLAGFGVEGDAHAGVTVKHRSRVRRDPTQPNLRQVHLLPAEIHDELAAAGFTVQPGDIGENITTRDVDLLALPVGTRLRLGENAVVELTGLRNPCTQLVDFQPGLMSQLVGRDDQGAIVRRGGVMGVVVGAGHVRAGDPIAVELPPQPHVALEVV
jgi:MOSC domain-containing protein YiiM